MKPWLFMITIMLAPVAVNAQGEFMNWHFGQGVALNFMNGIPEKKTSMITSSEGVASVSDAAGNLLFYTNGLTVWDRDHQVMLNGDGLLGGLSSVQGALILPMPGNDLKYYLFTVTPSGTPGNLYYNIIDMSGNGGKGMIEPASKNIFVTSSSSEKMASAKSTNCDYWLITHMTNSNLYEARRITASGIEPPVQTYSGAIQIDIGCIKVAPNNKRVVATNVNGMVELVDFDNNTGVFSKPVPLPVTTNNLTYTACFSPDNSKLYVNEGGWRNNMDFYQFDLSDPDSAAIVASKVFLGNVTTGSTLSLADLQIAPDGKIYFTRVGTSCLGAIPDPNEKAPMCGIVDNAVCNLGFLTLCLPNSVQSRAGSMNFSIGPDTTLCPGGSLQLSVPDTLNAIWSNGAISTTITVNTNGTYWVKINDGQCSATDSINISFNGKQVDLGSDTSICIGSTIRLQLQDFTNYLWSDLSSGSSFDITSSGKFWVHTIDACGVSSSDTINITDTTLSVSLGAGKAICLGSQLQLQASPGYTSYQWGPDFNIDQLTGTTVTVHPSSDTSYYVKASVEGCVAFDTVFIKVHLPEKPGLPGDTAICEGKSITVHAGNFSAYTWHDGSHLSFINLDTPVIAWVEIKDKNGCFSRDSIVTKWKDCGSGVWIPTAFSPNNDLKNDEFKAGYEGQLEYFRLTVYNRMGTMVFTSSDPNLGWDGKYRNIPAATQVFIWTCEYKLKNKDLKKETGTLTLIR